MGFFSQPNLPPPTRMAPPPSPTSPDADTAEKTRKSIEQAQTLERQAKGRAATILTDVKAMEEEAASKKSKFATQLQGEDQTMQGAQ